MLLRIDLYPANNTPQKDVVESPSSTLYSCLATASPLWPARTRSIAKGQGHVGERNLVFVCTKLDVS